MKLIFDITMALENVAIVTAFRTVVWLHSRYHWITPPDSVDRAMRAALISSASSVLLGALSFITFRLMKTALGEDLSYRKTWAVVSMVFGVVLLFVSVLPVRVG